MRNHKIVIYFSAGKTGGQIIDNVELSQRDEYELRPDDSSNNTQNAAANNTKDPADSWTQRDQKLLEQALARYPKGASERWEKVSEYIPGKSKVSTKSYLVVLHLLKLITLIFTVRKI